jgi:hypothetical protein
MNGPTHGRCTLGNSPGDIFQGGRWRKPITSSRVACRRGIPRWHAESTEHLPLTHPHADAVAATACMPLILSSGQRGFAKESSVGGRVPGAGGGGIGSKAVTGCPSRVEASFCVSLGHRLLRLHKTIASNGLCPRHPRGEPCRPVVYVRHWAPVTTLPLQPDSSKQGNVPDPHACQAQHPANIPL